MVQLVIFPFKKVLSYFRTVKIVNSPFPGHYISLFLKYFIFYRFSEMFLKIVFKMVIKAPYFCISLNSLIKIELGYLSQ